MRFKQSSILCLFFYVFVLVGCSSLQPKEEIIQGNIFKLDYPKLILDVSDEMTYAGKHEATNRDSYISEPKESITIERN